jgi:PKHD-type hydroxylase
MIYEYLEAFYTFKLSDENIKKMDLYVNGPIDLEYVHHQFDFNDEHDNVYHEIYRSCDIHYPPLDSILGDIAYDAISKINHQYYQYELSNDYELQLIKYYTGGRYEWHCDYGVSARKGVYRKLSMTIQLSDPSEYDGGELEIVDYTNRTHTVPKEKGMFVVFDSRVPHRVNPVTRGKRIALVGWANGPKLR